MADSRLTQTWIELLSTRGDETRLTQTTLEVLSPRAKPSRLTQTFAEVLSKRKACVTTPCPQAARDVVAARTHRFAHLWAITRPDGEVLRITDHIGAIPFDGETYAAAAGAYSTASDHPAAANEHTSELGAAIVLGGVELDDLEANKWQGSQVTETIVDWRYPWLGCIRKHRWYFREVRWDGEVWIAQLGGIASRFYGKRGDVYSASCTRDLGDAFGLTTRGCKFDLPGAIETATVAAVLVPGRKFRVTGLTAALGDDYFPDGAMAWTSGENDGLASTVLRSEELAGAYDIETILTLPHTVAIGDTFTVGPGCNKTQEDCQFFDQIANREAFDFMPGESGRKINPQ